MSSHTFTTSQIAEGIYDMVSAEWNFVPLQAIRAEWAGHANRGQVDQALTSLSRDRRISLIPQSNQKILTEADRDAALWLGGEYRHLAYIPGRV
jgi:hypothetical protein